MALDPAKRCTIADMRNHPWFLMEYTDLASQIEAQPEVTAEMIEQARKECMAVGEEFIRKQQEQAALESRLKVRNSRTSPSNGHYRNEKVRLRRAVIPDPFLAHYHARYFRRPPRV